MFRVQRHHNNNRHVRQVYHTHRAYEPRILKTVSKHAQPIATSQKSIDVVLPKLPRSYMYHILRYVNYQKIYMVIPDKNIRDIIKQEQIKNILITSFNEHIMFIEIHGPFDWLKKDKYYQRSFDRMKDNLNKYKDCLSEEQYKQMTERLANALLPQHDCLYA